MTISKDKLERLMVNKGVSSSELAKRLGVQEQSISKMKRNKTCRLRTALKLCQALECNVEEIIEESEVRT